MILPGSTTEYCQTQKHDHLQTRQSVTLCGVDPPFASNTQDGTYRGTSDRSVSAYEQWGARSAASVCRSATSTKQHADKQKVTDLKRKVKKKTQQTGNKFPEIWLLHLPAKVSKDWGTVGGGRGEAGTTAGWSNGRPRTLSPPPTQPPPHFGIEGPWLAGPAGAACGGWDGVWEEVLRCGAPARLPEERRQEALGKTLPSPVCSAPPAGQRAWRCKSGASEQEAEVLE